MGLEVVEFEVAECAACEIAFGVGGCCAGLANGFFEGKKVVVSGFVEALHINNDGIACFGFEENGAAIGLAVGNLIIINDDSVLELVIFVEHKLVVIDNSGVVGIDGGEDNEDIAVFVGFLDSAADGVGG